jgi:hypothetical protein
MSMTSQFHAPEQDTLLGRITKFVLPLDGEESPPPDAPSYWADCELAFRDGLALGVLKPDLARRLLAEIISEDSEREHVLMRLVAIAEGQQPLTLSEMDGVTDADVEQAVEDLTRFVEGELAS